MIYGTFSFLCHKSFYYLLLAFVNLVWFSIAVRRIKDHFKIYLLKWRLQNKQFKLIDEVLSEGPPYLVENMILSEVSLVKFVGNRY